MVLSHIYTVLVKPIGYEIEAPGPLQQAIDLPANVLLSPLIDPLGVLGGTNGAVQSINLLIDDQELVAGDTVTFSGSALAIPLTLAIGTGISAVSDMASVSLAGSTIYLYIGPQKIPIVLDGNSSFNYQYTFNQPGIFYCYAKSS